MEFNRDKQIEESSKTTRQTHFRLYNEDFTLFERKPSCRDCFYYKGCKDCYFEGVHLCPKSKKESEDTE